MTNFKEKLTKQADESLSKLQAELLNTQARHAKEITDIQDKIDEVTFKKGAYTKAK